MPDYRTGVSLSTRLGGAEACRHVHRDGEGERDLVLFHRCQQHAIKLREAVAQREMGSDGIDDLVQLRPVVGQLADANLGSALPGGAGVLSEVAQQTANVVVDGGSFLPEQFLGQQPRCCWLLSFFTCTGR